MPARFRKLLPVFVVALVLPALAATARAPLAEWFFERALEAKQTWRLERAIRLFDWAGRLGSDPHAARLEKAVCLQLRGRFADARREIDDLAVDRLGLIEAFLNAGARRVVASLLSVEDLPTHEFMRELYGHLRSTSAADALAATQRAFVRGQLQAARDGRPPAVQHPRYWAPFILVGDFR